MDPLLPSGGDSGIFALLYQCRDDLDKANKKIETLERERTAAKIDWAREAGRLDQESRHIQDLMASIIERNREQGQSHAALAAHHEATRSAMGQLDRELHGQVVRIQTIGTAIGGFLTIAQAIQFFTSVS